MKKLILFLAFFTLLAAARPLWAAKVVLKEGKVLHGKITDESEEEITLRIGPNMYLRIERNNIKEIIGAKRKPAVTSKTQPKSKPKAKPAASSGEAKTSLIQLVSKTKKRVNKKDNITIYESVIYKTYEVSGKTLEKVAMEIFDRTSGKGFPDGRRREASQTLMESSFGGKVITENGKSRWGEVVVWATMTVTGPFWKAPKKVSRDTRAGWNAFIKGVKKHDLGHMDIYFRAIIEVGESAAALRMDNEKSLRENSAQIHSTLKNRAQKRQKGFDRRNKISLP